MLRTLYPLSKSSLLYTILFYVIGESLSNTIVTDDNDDFLVVSWILEQAESEVLENRNVIHYLLPASLTDQNLSTFRSAAQLHTLRRCRFHRIPIMVENEDYPLFVALGNNTGLLDLVGAGLVPHHLQRNSQWLLTDNTESLSFVEALGPIFESRIYIISTEFIEDGEELISIDEVYKVESNSSLRRQLAETWNPDSPNNPCLRCKFDLWNRRSDLGGATWTVGLKENRPFLFVDDDGSFHGFDFELWKVLAGIMNVTARYHVVGDLTSTEWKDDNTYGGLVGLVSQGKLDLLASKVTETAERRQYVDFLTTIFHEK